MKQMLFEPLLCIFFVTVFFCMREIENTTFETSLTSLM